MSFEVPKVMPTPRTYNPPHLVYHWFMSFLARAYESDTLQISADPGLEKIRESVILNRRGKGTRAGISIEFDPENQLLTLNCQTATQADSLAEALRANDRFQTCVIVEIPRHFFLKKEDGTPKFPTPTDRED